MNKRRVGTLLVAGIFGASLLISPLAFATGGTSAGGGTAGVGQQAKPHTGGKHHNATGKRAKRKIGEARENWRSVRGAEETNGAEGQCDEEQ